MTPRYWIEFRGTKKVGLFVAMVALLWLFLAKLPGDISDAPLHSSRGPRLMSTMVMLWVGGWFLALFVRAEDLDLTTNFDYQTLNRIIGGFMILLALGIAGFFSISFFV